MLLVRSVTGRPALRRRRGLRGDPRARLPDLLRLSGRQGRRDRRRAPSSPSRPCATLVCVGVFVAIVAATRYVSLGSVVAMVLLPPVAGGLFHAPAPVVAAAAADGRPRRPQAPREPQAPRRRDGAQAGAEVKVARPRRRLLGHGARDRASRVRATTSCSGGATPRWRRASQADGRHPRRLTRLSRSRRRSASAPTSRKPSPSRTASLVAVPCASLRPLLELSRRRRPAGGCASCRRPRESSPRRCKRMSEILRERYPEAGGRGAVRARRSRRASRGETRRPPSSRRGTARPPRRSRRPLEPDVPALPLRRPRRRRARRRAEERRRDRGRHRRRAWASGTTRSRRS